MKIEQIYANYKILEEIGRRIREYRIGLFLTQNELSEKTGVSVRTICNIERGKDTSFNNIISILQGLNLVNNLELLIPENKEYVYQETKEKKRYKKSLKDNSTWKWGDEQ